MLQSSVCRYEDFFSDWYLRWAPRLNIHHLYPMTPGALMQRKAWEWCAIAQALEERGMLTSGKVGCGFAVGTEPLASAFAARGVRILATDQPLTGAASTWTEGNQHATSRDALHHAPIIDLTTFQQRVSFKPVDMRDLAPPLEENYDFIWSSCSFEHLGTLEAGMTFVLHAMDLLKPGGVAVHTTEFNVSSNADTIEAGENVLYRQQDLEKLDHRLRGRSCAMSRLNLYGGDHQVDAEFDYPPYFTHGRHHVKLLLEGYVATSVLLIIRKGADAAGVTVAP